MLVARLSGYYTQSNEQTLWNMSQKCHGLTHTRNSIAFILNP